MDDFPEKQPQEITKQEESTVFSAPMEHIDENLKSPKKSRIITAIAAVLVVCLLVGGTLAVIKLIPKKDDGSTASETKKLLVLDLDKSEFETVTVENDNGKFEFYKKSVESEDGSDEKWYIKNLPEEKISTLKTENVISSVAKIEAIMEITKKTYEECGFNQSTCRVSVASNKSGDFSLLFGSVSPDNSGVYLYSSIDEKIYLVSDDIRNSFEFNDLDFASSEMISPVTDREELSSYVDDGNLISFDKIVVSAKRFSSAVTIEPLNEDDVASIGLSYRITAPVIRYADTQNAELFLSLYTSGISVEGVYSFKTDLGTLEQFGLNKPDYTIALYVGGHSYSYKFALQPDGSYAVYGDGIDIIKKVSSSSIGFLSVKESDLYSKILYLRSISDIKNMTFVLDNETYSFDISENSENDEEKYTVLHGDKKIKSAYFQNFYMHFVSLSLVDFSGMKSGKPEMTVNITDNNGKVQKIEFYKSSATEYYCSLDGEHLGKITASSYNSFVNDIKKVSANKDVEER